MCGCRGMETMVTMHLHSLLMYHILFFPTADQVRVRVGGGAGAGGGGAGGDGGPATMQQVEGD